MRIDRDNYKIIARAPMPKVRTNPFRIIYDACNSNTSSYKIDHLPNAARFVDVELANVCNFRCLMCWGQTAKIQRKKGFMSDDVFEKLFQELVPKKIPVRFIRWGEPFLHPKIMLHIKRLHEAGILVHINTNGSALTDEVMRELIDIPLDSIKFSFQGVDREGYHEMRNKDNFESLLETIRRLNEIRGNKPSPYLHVATTITNETPEQIRQFKKRVDPIADLVTIGRTTLDHIDVAPLNLTSDERNRLLQLRSNLPAGETHPDCQEVFDKLSINFDGTVSACCTDFDNLMLVGDLKEQSLEEIWNGEKMSFYRRELAAMRHDKFQLCRSCFEYK